MHMIGKCLKYKKDYELLYPQREEVYSKRNNVNYETILGHYFGPNMPELFENDIVVILKIILNKGNTLDIKLLLNNGKVGWLIPVVNNYFSSNYFLEEFEIID